MRDRYPELELSRLLQQLLRLHFVHNVLGFVYHEERGMLCIPLYRKTLECRLKRKRDHVS